MRNCAIPVIAAVNGPALGAGCVLASVCDIRIAAANATFGLPEINVGRCGGGAHVGRYVPQGMLRKMFFTGRPISAEEAYRVNLIEEIVPAERLMDAARELAGIISEKAPLGLRLGKKALNEIEFMPVEEGYAREQTYSTKLMHTEDAREATRAVVEKRRSGVSREVSETSSLSPPRLGRDRARPGSPGSFCRASSCRLS